MNSTLTNSTLLELSDSSFVFRIVIRFTMSIQFLLGVSLNCYIIFLLLSRRTGADISVFILNHSAAEVLFSIAALVSFALMDIFNVFVYFSLTFLFGISICARLLFLCCVSLERYLAVVHPVIFLKLKPVRYRVACSVLVWTFSLLLGTAGYMLISPNRLLAVMFLTIVAVEFFCCVSILRKLRDPGPRDLGREQVEMNAAKKKAFQIILINLLTCLIQNIPIVVLNILSDFLAYSVSDKFEFFFILLNITAGIVQPLFKLHNAGKLSLIKCP